MEQLADKMVQMLEERKIIESVQREDYIYAVSCIAQAVVTNGVIFMLSIMYKTVWETFAFLLFFFGLRKASGGYHASSFGECFAESIGCYMGITVLSRYFSFSQGGCLIVFVLSVLIILVIGSVNLIGNEKNEIEYRLSKIAARKAVLLESGIIGVMSFLHFSQRMIGYLALSIILCACSLILAKRLGQEVKKRDDKRYRTSFGRKHS